MSQQSDRGRQFELKVAKVTRAKIDRMAKRNAGSHANWNRRSDVYTELPIHIEAKDQETLKPKEWFRQADEAAAGKTPVVVFQMDADLMCLLRYDDLLNLFIEIADLRLEIADLRRPVKKVVRDTPYRKNNVTVSEFNLTDGTLKRDIKLCKNGHICTPGRTTCMVKGCIYSSTYIKPKAKKEGRK